MSRRIQFFGGGVVLLAALLLTSAPAAAQSRPLPPLASQTTITVTGQNNAAEDYGALQQALAQAASGDTLQLAGVFDLTGCAQGLLVTKNITITGAGDPNATPETATRIHGCGPAFAIAIPAPAPGALTFQNLYFHAQQPLSIQFQDSANPVNILNNRFTGNIPLNQGGVFARFAVGAAAIGGVAITGTITVENNHVDWSDAPDNAAFAGDDNGFAFAAANVSLVIRNNHITTLGEGIEIEGNHGQDNTYLVAGNVVNTQAAPSPAGTASGPVGSVGEALQGGHPAAIKVHANEGVFVVRDNAVTLTGSPSGVCYMATTRHDRAVAGAVVHLFQGNRCSLSGHLAGLLGAWGETVPFFRRASLSGALVTGNSFTGAGALGIALIDRTGAPLLSDVTNVGHNNLILFNSFAGLAATRAHIAFDSRTQNNEIAAWPDDQIADLGDNLLRGGLAFLPLLLAE